jgi:hypothetical protein
MGLVREGPVADPDEARELRWLAPAAAQARLTHPGEQRLLAEALPSAPPLP